MLAADEQPADASAANLGYAFDFDDAENADLQPICAGVATGRLIGGNLAVICGLIGTPFEIETAGRVLFLEDISERAYRIDRYLSQLRLADKLSAVAGVLLGTFSYEEGEKADEQSDIRGAVQRIPGAAWRPGPRRLPCRTRAIQFGVADGRACERLMRINRVYCVRVPDGVGRWINLHIMLNWRRIGLRCRW